MKSGIRDIHTGIDVGQHVGRPMFVINVLEFARKLETFIWCRGPLKQATQQVRSDQLPGVTFSVYSAIFQASSEMLWRVEEERRAMRSRLVFSLDRRPKFLHRLLPSRNL